MLARENVFNLPTQNLTKLTQTRMSSQETLSLDLSDKLQVVDRSNIKKNLYTFDLDDDIYDIISHFLDIKSSDEPFYIVDLGEIQHRFQQWTENLPRVQPFYAIKSNPDPMILDVLAKLGCGFDCASKDEIIMAKSTGIQVEKLLYANPVKENESLQYARSQDVDLLTFDSDCELDKIKLFHPDANCIIRIKVDDSGSVCQFNSKFGCSFDEAKELLELAKIDKVNVVGVSFHCGSNCKAPGQFTKAIRDARQVFDMALSHGFKMNILDIGGGFPGYPDDNCLTFELMACEINEALDTYFGDKPDVKFIAEPGRFFCASSHTLVTTVIGIKTANVPASRANKEVSFGYKKNVLLDEQNSDAVSLKSEPMETEYKYTINEGVYNSFNCIIFDHCKPIILPFNERTEKTFRSTVFGHSCDNLDTIASGVLLPKLSIGDRLFVQNFGAYTRASSSSFNGFKTSLIYYIIKN